VGRPAPAGRLRGVRFQENPPGNGRSMVRTILERPAARLRQRPGSVPTDRMQHPERGLNPFLVVGVALIAGVVLARWIDWRGRGDALR
jgi:hypothetical protein